MYKIDRAFSIYNCKICVSKNLHISNRFFNLVTKDDVKEI